MSDTVVQPIRPILILLVNEIDLMGNAIKAALKDKADMRKVAVAFVTMRIFESGAVVINGGRIA